MEVAMTEPQSFTQIMQWSELEARRYLASIRWPNGPVCPNGCAAKVYEFEAKTRRKGKVTGVRHLLKCSQCKRQFTVTLGTIFEDSKVPLNQWLAAIWLMCASKKGMSAHEIHRLLDVHYRTAWYMCHRIRHAIKERGGDLLSGVIEADETYVGGKARGPMKYRKGRKAAPRVTSRDKTPVFGILERGGRVRTVVIAEAKKADVERELWHHVDHDNSVLITDESKLYGEVKKILPHKTVKHLDEYVTGGDIHTQGIEGFWSRLKRQLYGTHHHVKAGYLGMYADEAAFKHNTRELTDRDRFSEAMRLSPGRRLAWFASSAESPQEAP